MAISSLWNFVASLALLEVAGGAETAAASTMAVTAVEAEAPVIVAAGGPPLARGDVNETSLGTTLTGMVRVGGTMIHTALLPGCPNLSGSTACLLLGGWAGLVPGGPPLKEWGGTLDLGGAVV